MIQGTMMDHGVYFSCFPPRSWFNTELSLDDRLIGQTVSFKKSELVGGRRIV